MASFLLFAVAVLAVLGMIEDVRWGLVALPCVALAAWLVVAEENRRGR